MSKAPFVGAIPVIGAALFCLCIPACSNKSKEPGAPSATAVKGPAMHAVTQDRLREIMRSLQYAPMPDADTAGALARADRERQMKEAATVATKMAQSTKDIAPLAEKLGLNDQEKELFAKLGTKLASQSSELSALLDKGQTDGAALQMTQMQGTCQACHALFHPSGIVPIKAK